ncbi:MAG TPA: hypothetical protein VH370_17890 [Humisphaera sp.]|jgi:uncharacterized membrane protein YcjF (UPF0283 family)|nr:hypothetical protein [Humisphaera sp.]
MGNFWLKLKVYTKVTVFGLLLLYVLAFVFKNQGYPAKMWVAPEHTLESTVLLVALCAFLAGAVVTILIRTTLITLRQFRDLKERSRAVKLERSVQELQSKAAMLREKPGAVVSDADTAARPSERASTKNDGPFP